MDVQQRISDVVVCMRTVDDPEDRDQALKEPPNIKRHVKSSREKLVKDTPRRGAVMECDILPEVLHLLVPGITKDQVYPHTRDQQEQMLALELWREAECLVRRPHTFEALRHLPELQQIVMHTAGAAVSACAGRLSQLGVFAQSAGGTRGPGNAASASPDTPGTSGDWIGSEACQRYRDSLSNGDTDLLDHLIPALRLCLAAEVAISMLCPGQDPPPDTPEHAAALAMFIDQANTHLETELRDGDNVWQPHDYSVTDSLRNFWKHIPGFMPTDQRQQQQDQEINPAQQQQQLADQAGGQQQQQQQQQYGVHPPPDDQLGRWGLSPHLDLQMHVPPDQLLLLLQSKSGLLQQQQQQQQQQRDPPVQITAGATATADDNGSGSNSGSSSVADLGFFADRSGRLDQLFGFTGLEAAAVLAAQHAQHGSSSSNEDLDDVTALEQLILACGSLLMSQASQVSGSDGQQQQQQQATVALTSALASAGEYVLQQQQTEQDSDQHQQQQNDDQHNNQQQQQQGGDQQHDQQQQQQQGEGTGDLHNDGQQQAGDQVQQQDSNQHEYQQQQHSVTVSAETADDISSDPGDIGNSSSSSSSGSTSISRARDAKPAVAGAQHVVDLLPPLAGSLVLQFLTEQQAAAAGGSSGAVTAWQQLLPLQILLLLGQVQKLQGLSRQYEKLGAGNRSGKPEDSKHNGSSKSSSSCSCNDAECGEPSSSSSSRCRTGDTQQQQLLQQMLQHTLELVQLLRQLKDSNASLIAAAAAAAAGSLIAEASSTYGPTLDNCSSSSTSSSKPSVPEVQPMPPDAFFSAAGPLSAVLPGQCMQPGATAGAADLAHNAASSSSSSRPATGAAGSLRNGSPVEPGAASSNGGGSSHVQGLPDHALHDLIWQTLIGCCCWDQATADTIMTTMVHLTELGPALQTDFIRGARQTAAQLQSHDLQFAASMMHHFPGQGSLQDLLPIRAICELACIPDLVKGYVMQWRLALLKQLGYDLSRWEALQDSKLQRLQRIAEIRERISVNINGVQCILRGRITPDDEAFVNGHTPEQNQWLAAAAADDDAVDAAGSSSSSGDQGLQHELDEGLAAYRQLGLALCQQCTPLYLWHKQWYHHHHAQQQQAKAWWDSAERQQLAQQGCVNPRPLQQQQLSVKTTTTTSRSSNGIDSMWQHGSHDRHPKCPLCQQEQQQQQSGSSDGDLPQQLPGSSVPAGPYSTPAVPYADSFLWRRLLWQLLGKLSPVAQAAYAHYTAMCPHCTNRELWGLVKESIICALWSSPSADVVGMQLYTRSHATLGHNEARPERVKLYAKAINTAYLQTHSPAAVVLAKQVLLSLSALHHSVAPAPESALYLPSSFTAAAAKALQQQLLGRPLLQGFAHDRCSLTPWHVYWHLGIRRYHARGYQHRKQQGLDLGQRQARDPADWLLHCLGGNNGVSSSSGGCGGSLDVDAMYLNADARLYAVGFATRQLNGAAASKYQATGSGDDGKSDMKLPTSDYLPVWFQHQLLALMRDCEDELFIQAAGQHIGTPWETLRRSAEAGCKTANQVLQQYRDLKRYLHDVLIQRELRAALRVLSEPEYPLVPEISKHQQSDSSALPYAAVVGDYVGEADPQCSHHLLSKVAGKTPFDCLVATTDVQELALQAPVAVETLIDPSIWWDIQQKMLGLDNACEHCDRKLDNIEAASTCAHCSTPLYCSTWCADRDAAEHAVMCHKLQQASQRYSTSAGSSGAVSKAQQPFQRLLDLMSCQGEGGVLDCHSGVLDNLPPGIVEPHVFVVIAGQHLQQLSPIGTASKEMLALSKKAGRL